MVYAPIIIPTLNRYEHLKRCVKSLQQNGWAKYTELYISVDYPAKESHWEGYRKVREYLEDGIEGFQKVNLFYQQANLGGRNNIQFLIQTVFELYDICIATEDDNEFSPCFIEFMGWSYLKMIRTLCIYVGMFRKRNGIRKEKIF